METALLTRSHGLLSQLYTITWYQSHLGSILVSILSGFEKTIPLCQIQFCTQKERCSNYKGVLE